MAQGTHRHTHTGHTQLEARTTRGIPTSGHAPRGAYPPRGTHHAPHGAYPPRGTHHAGHTHLGARHQHALGSGIGHSGEQGIGRTFLNVWSGCNSKHSDHILRSTSSFSGGHALEPPVPTPCWPVGKYISCARDASACRQRVIARACRTAVRSRLDRSVFHRQYPRR